MALALVLAAGAFPSDARAEHAELDELSLEELLEIDVEAPTKTSKQLRATPGVVTVITREEILRSGARDLVDVLELVPGLFFGVDVQGMISLGVRGNWGEEGKVLLLWDGRELNEPLYLTTQFGNHFPVSAIARIEVIRGPGSVIYGGNAELAVINIIPLTAAEIEGAYVDLRHGQFDGERARTNLSLSAGHVFDGLDDLSVRLSAFFGDAVRSDETYADLYGNAYPLTNADLDPRLVDLAVAYRGLEVAVLYDGYITRTRDAFDESLPRAVKQDFSGLYADATYAWKLTDELELLPRLSYKRQHPWRVTDLPDGQPIYYSKTTERSRAGVSLVWRPREMLELLVGGELLYNRAELDDLENLDVGLQRLLAEGVRDDFVTVAAFSQAVVEHSLANFSAGVRYEHNDRFGGAVVPRVGVTRAFDELYVKLLASRAFKAPGHENYVLNDDIDAELTTVYEVEAGYRFGDHWFTGANVFDISISDPIIFFFDEDTGGESYVNGGKTGTRGVEGEVRFRYPWARASLRYSYYNARDKNDVDTYRVPGKGNVLRAWPAHKVTAHGTIFVTDDFTLNPQLLFFGGRYGTLAANATGAPVVGEEGPTWLLGISARYENLLVDGLDVDLTVHDLLDEGVRYLQPHDSNHAPLPGPSREWGLRVGYRYRFE